MTIEGQKGPVWEMVGNDGLTRDIAILNENRNSQNLCQRN